ncbi:FadR/GntR family transcriptional regulator [Youxingia wuxianensis]|uniref:FadR family transcriptional regulator n=1 Tax=Youxingia wuxianensis TaxID=2763678 RepID=A0A926ESH1_9FIRM|nr:FadR/GntR family transcriptional regulator [Youxingia wuxianensis]MBC8585460.1 FadR family transcriptional regulator [Youxingia wuxianensis]
MNHTLMSQKELPSVAAQRLREMVLEKKMKPGDRFPTEGELISMFGVSRSTVREAVKILVAENLVEIHRGRGTFIAQKPGMVRDPLGLSYTDQKKLFENLMETRMMIEPQIAYLAAQRANEENLSRLRGAIAAMEQAQEQHIDYRPFDVEFHSAVAECSHNDVLQRILPIICDSIRTGYFKTYNVPGSYQKSVVYHNKIYLAIKNHDSQAAKFETEQHIRQTMEDAKLIPRDK